MVEFNNEFRLLFNIKLKCVTFKSSNFVASKIAALFTSIFISLYFFLIFSFMSNKLDSEVRSTV